MKLTAFREAILASHRVREFEKPGGSFNPHDKLKLPEKAARYLFYENKPDENGYRAFQLHELFHIFGQVPMFPAQQIPFYENDIVLDIGIDGYSSISSSVDPSGAEDEED